MEYRHIKIPTTGEKITIQNGKVVVPDQPIVGYVEGDGIGPDITAVTPSTVSLMPAGLDEQITRQELADLIEFLKNTRWGR